LPSSSTGRTSIGRHDGPIAWIAPSERRNFSPFRLSRLLAAANRRGIGGELVCVEIHRGIPSQKHDWIGYMANRRQEAPTEKGVDVELAVSAIEATSRNRCDVAIIFTHDTDLLPVPEAIARLVGPERVETASWASRSFQGRLRPRAPVVHHPISQKVFEAVETQVSYARTKGARSLQRT